MQKMSLVAYHRLLELMGNRSLQVGDFISHRQLATRLNLGKQSISQALDVLEQKGLVESIPKVGTRIRPVTPDDVWGVLQWRVAVECRTAYLAAQWISQEQREKIVPLSRELDELVRNPPDEMEITYRH
ncbi:MAG: GntR family transcriptional regulator, partial [Planctomycetia bacterium]|nr:GntR family transcriptional regulator [Planctomycetia bacterium]